MEAAVRLGLEVTEWNKGQRTCGLYLRGEEGRLEGAEDEASRSPMVWQTLGEAGDLSSSLDFRKVMPLAIK